MEKSSFPKGKKVSIRTFGCQMNVYDSQVAAGLLEKAGFEVIREPESTGDPKGPLSGGADVVIMNTCSVRDHAEQRVWGRLGMLGVEKKERPDLILGLMGCMVEEHGDRLFKRFPQLDFLIGTRNVRDLPTIIGDVGKNRAQAAAIGKSGISIEYSEFTKRDSPFHAWLPVMTGCDKECTFCIVPKTRGAEVSVPADKVVREAERLVSGGVKWITLLGQNVNSYIGSEKGNSFPGLLEMLCHIGDLERISFTTSHPSDATEELFQMIAKNPKISRRFHLPLQSGSDKILKRMKRYHTYGEYTAKINRLRELVPDVSITTDIIVGFSGETEEDYLATKRSLEEIRFDGAFIYKYSVRPGTPAEKLPDDVSPGDKALRNNELLAIQRTITDEKNRENLGKVVSAFVEEAHPERKGEWFARTDQDRRIVFPSLADLRGKFVRLRVIALRHETFLGEVV